MARAALEHDSGSRSFARLAVDCKRLCHESAPLDDEPILRPAGTGEYRISSRGSLTMLLLANLATAVRAQQFTTSEESSPA
jgi:hypothetical protein